MSRKNNNRKRQCKKKRDFYRLNSKSRSYKYLQRLEKIFAKLNDDEN